MFDLFLQLPPFRQGDFRQLALLFDGLALLIFFFQRALGFQSIGLDVLWVVMASK
jgi:hypothetical protein